MRARASAFVRVRKNSVGKRMDQRKGNVRRDPDFVSRQHRTAPSHDSPSSGPSTPIKGTTFPSSPTSKSSWILEKGSSSSSPSLSLALDKYESSGSTASPSSAALDAAATATAPAAAAAVVVAATAA
eukprot:5514485-Pleurochrysis_carterae.AAC.1